MVHSCSESGFISYTYSILPNKRFRDNSCNLFWQAALGKPQAVISEEALAERNEKLKMSRNTADMTNGTASHEYSGKFKSREEMAIAEGIGEFHLASHNTKYFPS
jgi:hypothetical protein